MSITAGSTARADDFINNAQRNATPANDAGRVPKLETTGKLHASFIPNYGNYVANENMTAGMPVGLSDIMGGVARAMRKSTSYTHGETLTLTNNGHSSICPIGGDKVAFLQFSGANLYGRVATLDPSTNSITYGTKVAVTATATIDASMFTATVCKLDTDKFIVIYLTSGSTTQIKYRVGTVSGTTITFGTEATLVTAVSTVATSQFFISDQLATDKGCFAFGAATAADGQVLAFTVSGTVATAGTGLALGTFLRSNFNGKTIRKIGTDKFVMAGQGTQYQAQAFTVSGTTLTAGTEISISTASTASQTTKNNYTVSPAADVFVYSHRTGSGDKELVACTVSGTTITVGTAITITSVGNDLTAVHMESATDLLIFGITNSYRVARSGTTLTATLVSIGMATDGAHYTVTDNGDPVMVNTSSTILSHWNYGMSYGFLGFATQTVSAGASVEVAHRGVDENQSGLVVGMKYLVNDGILTAISPTTTINSLDDLYVVTALSSTSIVF